MTAGWAVSCIPMRVSVCLYVCRRLLLSACVPITLCVYVFIYVSIIVFVCRPVCWLSVWRSVCMFLFLSVNLAISVCLPVCVPVCVFISLSVCLSVCLSQCPLSVGRLSVFLSCQSVTVRTKRAGSGEGDAESERMEGYAHKSNVLRTQER